MSAAVKEIRPVRVRPWQLPAVPDAGASMSSPSAPAVVPAALPAPVAVVVPPPLTFTTADLAAACEQGRLEAQALAAESESGRAVLVLERIAAALGDADAAAADIARRAALSLSGVLAQALATAFPALEARLGPREVADLVAAILPGLSREPAVSVRVAESGARAVNALLDRLPAIRRGRVTLEVDPSLGPADLRIAWGDGQALRDGAATRDAVLAALAALTGEPVTEGDEP